MKKYRTLLRSLCKPFLAVMLVSALGLGACSTNPATGRTQFTGLMSPQQEVKVGAEEHEKIVRQFGLYKNTKLQGYVNEIGRRVSQDTERPDVRYQFFILDSPIVNAFAVPGGYIYVSRGLMALANSEAELAGVVAHETAHITARHSAERYSHGVLTSLGAAVISAAVDSTGVSQALGLGNNLYLSSYSRSQENEADSLGIRYLSRGGYDPRAMSSFLSVMEKYSALEARAQGKDGPGFSYFSTHPVTASRVADTAAQTTQYPPGGDWGRDRHLNMIDGMTYGDSADHGFARGSSFYHPKMRFAFDAPEGFQIINQPSQVIAVSKTAGAVVIFDMAGTQGVADPRTYLSQIWMKEQTGLQGLERITVNGMEAATASLPGRVDGRAVTIRLVAVKWSADRYARFQIAIPDGASTSLVEDLKRTSYSLRRLSDKDVQNLKPDRLRVITAKAGDTVKSLARRQAFTSLQEDRFRVLNGLKPEEQVQAGGRYKIVVN